MKTLILSHNISNSTPLYGGKKSIHLLPQKAIKKGDSCNVMKMVMNTHTSTHIDMPFHFLNKGKKISDYYPEHWIFKNTLLKQLEMKLGGVINKESFNGLKHDRLVDFLLIKTGFERFRGSSAYIKKSPIVDSKLAGFLKTKLPNLKAIGFDFISLSSLINREEGRLAHKEFLKRDILIIEDMKLSSLFDKPDYILISPLFIDGADASPVSVWAFYENFSFYKYDYLFFDFDGVILDSVDIKTFAFRELYKRYGQNVINKVVKHHRANGGMSRFDKFSLYHKKFLGIDLSKKEVSALAEKFSQIVFKKVLKADFIAGAKDFLEICRKNKKDCFLVSATPQQEIKKIIQCRKLKKYFKAIKGSPQSKEDNIRDIIAKYKLDKKRTVFFGDAINDLKAANSNCIKFIGINYHGSVQSFRNFEYFLKANA
jgi:kynurenine formamidase/phosphoglycolate phosphatase-like HAD superfamily hydrolase